MAGPAEGLSAEVVIGVSSGNRCGFLSTRSARGSWDARDTKMITLFGVMIGWPDTLGGPLIPGGEADGGDIMASLGPFGVQLVRGAL